MKNLRLFFALTFMLMFIITSCSKENLVPNEVGNAAFENVIDESEMIPSSELYDNAESIIEKLIKDIQNSDNDNTDAKMCCLATAMACPAMNASIQNWPFNPCDFQLRTKSKREVGQRIRIVHYSVPNGAVEYDFTTSVGLIGDDCSFQSIGFSIPVGLSFGAIYTFVLILDGNSVVASDSVSWNNC